MFRTQSTIGTLATILALAAWIGARADTQPATGLLNAFVNLNDSASVYRALYDNTPIEPEFKLVPKFAIVGADNKFVFSLGAQMKFTSSFDWGNPVRNPGGMGPSDIHAPVSSDRTLYQMTAGGSNIFFNMIHQKIGVMTKRPVSTVMA